MALQPDLRGDIWYVSKADGNDTLGSYDKGNPSRPLKTIWAAKDLAVSGDIIHVFPGTYTLGDVDSGSDKEGDGSDLDGTSLTKDGVMYVFEEGTVLQNNTTAIEQPLFYDITGQICRVYGRVELEIDDMRAGIAKIEHKNAVFEFVGKKVTAGDGTQFDWGWHCKRYSNIRIHADEHIINNARYVRYHTFSGEV